MFVSARHGTRVPDGTSRVLSQRRRHNLVCSSVQSTRLPVRSVSCSESEFASVLIIEMEKPAREIRTARVAGTPTSPVAS